MKWEADRLFLDISRREKNFKNRLDLSLNSLPVLSLPKAQVLRLHTTLQIWQTKSESIRRLSYEISVRVKGTTLPILVRVLTSIDYWKAWFLTLCSSLHTRNKQQKFAQEKLLCKPCSFGLSVSRNLNVFSIRTCADVYGLLCMAS